MSDGNAKANPESKQIFGSFFLAESEFAVAVSFVQEVVNAPASYTAVPLAPKYLKGLFNLRGVVIPVLDLRDHLQLGHAASAEHQKVAIIELENACVGLLFDKTGEIFRSHDEERSDFNLGTGSEVVSGVFKKNGGKRIVQILDVANLFKMQNVPKDADRNRRGRETLGKKRGNRKQCISFMVGPAKCALAISDIQEILKIENLNESALSIGHCIGTIDLRGTTVPVIDFAALLKYREVDRSDSATKGDRRIIVMKLNQELFGLLVESIDSIVSFFPDELVSFPLIEQDRGEMFLGCITGHETQDILLLDYIKILNDAEIAEITRGHSKIYQAKNSAKDNAAGAGARRTYITFQIDGTYAIPIGEVKEIIEYPKTLLQPPGLKKHVRGVLNLRGDMVTIIDARSLYTSMTEGEARKPETQKVLIFNKNGVHFGLIVDSVESIVSFNDRDKVKLPPMLYEQGEGSITADITEAVEVTDAAGQVRSMLIINSESISNRASKSLAA